MRVFIDTSAFVALRNHSEREHPAARRAFARLVKDRIPLLTSNFVFGETYTALLTRVGRDDAIEWGTAARTGSAIDVVSVDRRDEDEAWMILERFGDERWSYVDATSFVLIARLDVTHAFAFDRHFAQRGLDLIGP